MIDVSSSYISSRQDRMNSIIAQMAAAIRTLSNSTTKDTAISLDFHYFIDENGDIEKMDISASPCRPSIYKEILQAAFDKDKFSASDIPICDLIRMEIEPFIIGVGWITVEETPNGIRLMRTPQPLSASGWKIRMTGNERIQIYR